MKVETMTRINSLLSQANINYSLADGTDEDLMFPYWTSEFSTVASGEEDCILNNELSLTGIGKSWLTLKNQEGTIIEMLDGYRTELPSGSAILISYESSIVIPCEDASLKRIEMTFSIKEFSNE